MGNDSESIDRVLFFVKIGVEESGKLPVFLRIYDSVTVET